MSQRAWVLGFGVGVAVAACGGEPERTHRRALSPEWPAEAPPGAIATTISTDAAGMHVVVAGQGVDLSKLPLGEWLPFGLPLGGTGDIAVDVRVPIVHGQRDMTRAAGSVTVHCGSCMFGEEGFQAPIAGGAFADTKIDFGSVALGTVDATVTIGAGHAKWKAQTSAPSDLDIVFAGDVTFAAVPEDTTIEACLRFRVAPAPGTSDAKTGAIVATAGAVMGADGYMNLRISGPWVAVRVRAQVCDGTVPLPADEPYVRTRPQLTTGNAPTDPTPADADPDSDDLGALLARTVKEIDPTTFEVNVELLEKLTANPMAVAKGARIVPAMTGGKPAGFKLYAIRPSSVFAHLGLANGDTLSAIDGTALTSADIALDVYVKVAKRTAGSTVKVDLVRRGKPVTITYKLVK